MGLHQSLVRDGSEAGRKAGMTSAILGEVHSHWIWRLLGYLVHSIWVCTALYSCLENEAPVFYGLPFVKRIFGIDQSVL